VSWHFVYILCLVVIDSFTAIPPTNSEFWITRYVYERSHTVVNNKKPNAIYNFIYYGFCYVFSSLIGGIIAYLIGYFAKNNVTNLMNFLLYIILGSKNVMVSKFLDNYNPLKVLLLKSFTPGIPVSVFNILCGVHKSNMLNFLIVTVIFRSIRFTFIFTIKRYLKYKFIEDVIYMLTCIYFLSSCVLIIYCTYFIFEKNIFNVF